MRSSGLALLAAAWVIAAPAAASATIIVDGEEITVVDMHLHPGKFGQIAAPAGCDGPEDCKDGEHCCVGFPVGARCSPAACGGQDQELCNYDTDCASGNCTACRGPGSSLVYGLCTQGASCPSPYTAP